MFLGRKCRLVTSLVHFVRDHSLVIIVVHTLGIFVLHILSSFLFTAEGLFWYQNSARAASSFVIVYLLYLVPNFQLLYSESFWL